MLKQIKLLGILNGAEQDLVWLGTMKLLDRLMLQLWKNYAIAENDAVAEKCWNPTTRISNSCSAAELLIAKKIAWLNWRLSGLGGLHTMNKLTIILQTLSVESVCLQNHGEGKSDVHGNFAHFAPIAIVHTLSTGK